MTWFPVSVSQILAAFLVGSLGFTSGVSGVACLLMIYFAFVFTPLIPVVPARIRIKVYPALIPDKDFKLLQGGCPIHAAITISDVKTARALHPDALLLVHPECQPEVVKEADYVGSTSGIMDFAIESSHRDFIIGTEISIAEHLQYDCPDKRFYSLSKELICPNMKANTLMDVYQCVNGDGGEEILLDDATITAAKKCIDEMIRLG